MNVEELHDYCMSLKGATEVLPFDDVTLVLKVENKWFAVIPLDSPELQISVKCDPEKAVELRERYNCVTPAWHFNKKYWNTIYLNRDMKDSEVKQWICHSIDEVMKKLPKRVREEYKMGNRNYELGIRNCENEYNSREQKAESLCAPCETLASLQLKNKDVNLKHLVFATHNDHKLIELQELFKDKVILLSLNDLGVFAEIEETGKTLEENALLKAKFVFDKFGLNVFADDTGLEIDALNGAPGVISARFAGEDKDSQKNREKVLNLLKGEKNRQARFKTIIVLILDGKIYIFEGAVEGKILENPVGDKGFGYDPIFMPDGYDISFAQMELDEKNRISHRGKAVEKLINFLNLRNK